MSEVTVNCRMHGPLLINGKVTLMDHQGKPFDLGGKESIALCRCGASQKKPFCDGAHKTCGFQAAEAAT